MIKRTIKRIIPPPPQDLQRRIDDLKELKKYYFNKIKSLGNCCPDKENRYAKQISLISYRITLLENIFSGC